MTDQLGKLREQIDRLDREIQQLISERALCAQKVAEVKIAKGDYAADFYRPEREAQVLREVIARNQGPVANEEMARIFREIMSVCLALEKPIRVAYLGPEGTFTEAAALKHFGHSVVSVPQASIDDVFREVESGTVNYGVVPVENSTEGMVTHTLDSFMKSPLKICGEVELRIHHHLLVKGDEGLKQITRVYSHQQSLAQCRRWLGSNLPKAELISVDSNAEAARLVAEDAIKAEGVVAAIAGEMAAERYQLRMLAKNIEDYPDNTTRFLIIARQEVPASGKDKTSVLVATRNRPGALYQLLAPFQNAGISLTRIETRPSKSSNWTYVFFIDFEGHSADPEIEKVLRTITEDVIELKLLGSYPVAVM